MAFLLRTLLVLMTPVIGADASAYLVFAQEINRGLWAPALDTGIHPGYPYVITLFGALFGDLENGAYAVSVLFSSLAMIPFYVLVRNISNRQVALLSALFFACLPRFVLEHGDIMTEGLFHFLFVTSATLTWFSITRSGFTLAGLAGLTGGLAYLTRPEGIYLPVAAIGLWLLFSLVKRSLQGRSLTCVLLIVPVFLAVALPLLLWFRDATGHWTVSKRESVQRATHTVTTTGPALPASSHETGWGPALRNHLSTTLKISHGTLPTLALIGLFLLRGRFAGIGTAYLLSLSLGYAAAPLSAAVSGYALSHRYLLVHTLFQLPFMALCFSVLYEWIQRRWPSRRTVVISSVVFALLLLGGTVRAVHPRRTEDAALKEAALWLRHTHGAGLPVYANTHQVSYYLQTRARALDASLEKLQTLSLAQGEFIILVEKDLNKDVPGGLDVLNARFKRIRQFTDGDDVSIFAGSDRP